MLANISFDIDGLWSALNFHGVYSDPYNDYVIEQGVPRLLGLLKRYDIRTTLFVVGKNVENYKDLHSQIKEEQEIGNHSYSHPHNLRELTRDDIEKEILKCHEVIIKNLKVKSQIFRAPTYSINTEVIKILNKLNYRYDSSVMPAYFPSITPFTNLFLERKPYKTDGIFEIPLSVNPLVPIYVNGTTVIAFGIKWLKFSMKLLNMFNLPLVINFHDRDFVDIPGVLKKQFRRGNIDTMKLVNDAIAYIKRHAKLTSLEDIGEYYINNITKLY